jgi:hypothetical protein
VATTAPPANAPVPAAESTTPAREATAASSPSEPAQAAPEKPVKPEKVFVVQVKAKEDSWVSIVADGKSVMERVLTAEKNKKIKAGRTLILRTGNAGGIEVTFNGVSLGSLGNENEPRTLTFNAAGLVQ